MARQSRATLILTRPAQAAQRFAAELAAQVAPLPEILISPLMRPEAISAPVPEQPPDGVIFTSETGAMALSARVVWRTRAICVGPQTAAVAQSQGWQAEIVGPDAERMVAALRAAPLAGRWLHARGENAAAPLSPLLTALGMQVEEAVLYRQAPLPLSTAAREALKDPERHIILPIFSPRSGRLLVAEAAGLLRAPLWVAAISAAAARAMEPLAPPRVEVADEPDGPGMLRAVERLLTSDA